MKILIVNYEYPPLGGGGGLVTRSIARELAKRHTVHILTSSASGVPRQEQESGCDLTVFRARVLNRNARSVASISSMLSFYPYGIATGKQLMEQYDYDVINTWFAIPSGPTGVHLARRFKTPHLLTIVGGDIYDPSKWYSPHRNLLLKPVVKSVLASADRHTAISTDIARRARQYYNFDREINVIPLGINMPEYMPATRKELGLNDNKRYVITLGRIVRRKNLPTLVRALHLLQRPNVELIVLGDGPELATLKQLADELKIAGQIQFRGFVPDELKYQLMSRSDVFAMPSLHEGFGLVFLEAMACGLPIVATGAGGQEDFLQNGETGALVPHGDPEALRDAIARLLDGKDQVPGIVENNRSIAARFSISRTAQSYEQLLEETCNTPGEKE